MAQATVARPTRTDKAIGIITRAECIPLDDDTWKVRDTATRSGRWHITTSTNCDCRDARKGTCKHQLAVGLLERVEQDECERAERETADLLAHFAPQPAAMAAD